MEKLIEIQNELKAPKNQFNSFGKYKYRNQEDILEALKPLLKKHGAIMNISDEIKSVGDLVYVEATVSLTIGEQTTEVKAQAGINPNKKGMDISQSFGSSSSYARKYALNGMFLIDDTKDSDSIDNSKAEPKKMNVNSIPNELLENITKGIKASKTQEQLGAFYKAQEPNIKTYPQLKAMFTTKKVALNGN